MINTLLQLILVVTLFGLIKYLVYKWVNQPNYPEWLAYPPFNCLVCASFWTLLAVYAAIGIVFHFWWTMGAGILLAILNAIAMKVDEKNKTISVEEWQKMHNSN